jgi:hypothetical protein
VSSQLWSADALPAGALHPVEPVQRFTGAESDPETDAAHSGASWITWLLTARGERYRIFHHVESQVYLEEGFSDELELEPVDESA